MSKLAFCSILSHSFKILIMKIYKDKAFLMMQTMGRAHLPKSDAHDIIGEISILNCHPGGNETGYHATCNGPYRCPHATITVMLHQNMYPKCPMLGGKNKKWLHWHSICCIWVNILLLVKIPQTCVNRFQQSRNSHPQNINHCNCWIMLDIFN